MSTSSRSDSIAARLTNALPDLRPRLRDPLTGVLVGMSQTVASHQQRVADAMPLKTAQASKIQRFRRLLDNPKLTAEGIYHPIVQAALTGLRRQRVHVLLDRVVLTDTQNVLVVSLGFRRRSIPLVWRVLDHAGSSNLADQQTLLTAAIALLPPAVRILVHADSEFRSQALFAWIRSHGWDAMLGIRGNVTVTIDPAQAGRALETWLPDRDTVAYLNHVWLTEDQHGPVNVLAWKDRNDRNELICYAVMTNLPATWQTYRLGSRRMWIETMFRDWQSGGFELGKTAITDHARFHRLIILVCLIYLWFVSIGRWLVKRGYRHLLDTGPSDSWHRSLFALAVAWQHRCRTFDQSLAVFWFVYV
ncbi:MAG: transposase [Oscillochloris sp.]|nr:transposase [Oscillochloris sp.]